MPYVTTTDLINDALRRASEPIDGTSEYQAEALDYLNKGYSGLATGTLEQSEDTHVPWWWLLSPTPGIITLVPNLGQGASDGKATVTMGSTNFSFTVIPVNPLGSFISLAGWNIKFVGTSTSSSAQDIFRITSHSAGSLSAILDSPYTGPNATLNFNAFQLEYDGPTDLLYVVAPLRGYQTGKEKINVVSKAAMENMFPLTQITFGIPTEACLIGEQRFRFSHYVGAGTTTIYVRIDFDYIRLPPTLTGSPSEQPLVPFNYRSLLADFCLQQIFVAKSDDRAAGIGQLIKGKINGMRREHMARLSRSSENVGRVFPRQQDRASIRGPWRTESGLVIGY
jgi:hypothetical protein